MELLVTISIVTLILGILLPALGAARKSARNAQDMANLRSIGQLTDIYLAQSGGHYFSNYQPENNYIEAHPEFVNWFDRLFASVPETKIEVMQSGLDPKGEFSMKDDDDELRPMISYSINGYFHVIGNRQQLLWLPEETIFMAHRSDNNAEQERGILDEDLMSDIEFHFDPWKANNWWEDVSIERTLGGSSYLFCDGHVSIIPPNNVKPEMVEPGDNFKAARVDPEP